MALSNMKVFNKTVQTMATEKLAQDVEKFNAASGGAIVLTGDGFEGDYRYENFWASLHAAQRRVDRYARLARLLPHLPAAGEQHAD